MLALWKAAAWLLHVKTTVFSYGWQTRRPKACGELMSTLRVQPVSDELSAVAANGQMRRGCPTR